jgi:hypothetical protein
MLLITFPLLPLPPVVTLTPLLTTLSSLLLLLATLLLPVEIDDEEDVDEADKANDDVFGPNTEEKDGCNVFPLAALIFANLVSTAETIIIFLIRIPEFVGRGAGLTGAASPG